MLAAAAIFLAGQLGPYFAGFLLVFAILQVAYTFALKRVVIADVVTIALLFVVRAAVGAAAVDVRISPWLLVCTFLLALFLACAKRWAELQLVLAGRTPGRNVLRRYPPELLPWLIRLDAVAVAIVYLVYSLTAVSGPWMVVTVPFVVAGLVRYLQLMRVGEGEEPERTLLRDPGLRLCVILWVAAAVLVTTL